MAEHHYHSISPVSFCDIFALEGHTQHSRLGDLRTSQERFSEMDAAVCLPEFHFSSQIKNDFHGYGWRNWISGDGGNLGRRILGVFDSMADKSTRNPRNKTITNYTILKLKSLMFLH